MNSYDVYLGGVLLPVTPSKIQTTIGSNNEVIRLLSGGDVNVLKSPKLVEIDLEAELPYVKYPFAKYEDGFEPAPFFIKRFQNMKKRKRPVQFIVSRILLGQDEGEYTNIAVSIEEMVIKEEATDGMSVRVVFKLKQFKHYGLKTVTIRTPEANGSEQKATVEEERQSTSSPKPEETMTYSTKPGDTLWSIAKKFYGDGSKWKVIQEANIAKVPSPNKMEINLDLVIPKI